MIWFFLFVCIWMFGIWSVVQAGLITLALFGLVVGMIVTVGVVRGDW